MELVAGSRKHVVIDGSFGEGGGQILRCGLSLALITGCSVEFRNIRLRRPKPGLQPQHLTAVHAAATISKAQVEGAELGSMVLRFEPAEMRGGEFTFDVQQISGVGSAGSVLLIAQTILLPLALRRLSAQITLRGGTHVGWSPSADYIHAVYLPALAQMGIQAELDILANGFYPRGGGECVLQVFPASEIRPIQWQDRGAIKQVRIILTQSGLPDEVLWRGAEAAETLLGVAGLQPEIETTVRPSRAPGAAVTIAAECENGFAGFTSLGKRGKPIEQVVDEAWQQFLAWARSRTAVDPYLADQLVVPASLIAGESVWSTTTASSHLKTILWLMTKFLPVQNGVEPWDERGVLVRTRPAPD